MKKKPVGGKDVISESTITNEEWLASIKQFMKEPDNTKESGCFTATELRDALGVSTSYVQRILAKLISASKVEFAGKVPKMSVSGTMQKVPVYKVKK